MLTLYIIETGESVSHATVIDVIPDGMAVKPFVAPAATSETVLSRDDFLDLFSDDEMLSIVQTANTDTSIKDFLDVLGFRGRVRMNSSTTISAVNYMESIGLIFTGRVGEILNG